MSEPDTRWPETGRAIFLLCLPFRRKKKSSQKLPSRVIFISHWPELGYMTQRKEIYIVPCLILIELNYKFP